MVTSLETLLSHEDELAAKELHGLEEKWVVRIGQAEVLCREDSGAAYSDLKLLWELRHALKLRHVQLLRWFGVESVTVVGLGVESLGIEDANLLSAEDDDQCAIR